MIILDEVQTATRLAEQALLGAILIESSCGSMTAIHTARGRVRPEDFLGYLATAKPWDRCIHARIYQAMLSCQLPPHQINTAQEMNRLHILQPGDCAYLLELISLCPCALDYKSYAVVVARYAELRGIKRSPSYRGLIVK